MRDEVAQPGIERGRHHLRAVGGAGHVEERAAAARRQLEDVRARVLVGERAALRKGEPARLLVQPEQAAGEGRGVEA